MARFPISVAFAVMSQAALAQGTPDAPAAADPLFSEDFESQAFYNAGDSSVRWSKEGVTLGRSRGAHGLPAMQSLRVGNPRRVEGLVSGDVDGDGFQDVLVAGKRLLSLYLNRR